MRFAQNTCFMGNFHDETVRPALNHYNPQGVQTEEELQRGTGIPVIVEIVKTGTRTNTETGRISGRAFTLREHGIQFLMELLIGTGKQVRRVHVEVGTVNLGHTAPGSSHNSHTCSLIPRFQTGAPESI